MKISFGTDIVEGPWGGGNLFLINLKNYLENQGHEVVFGLEDNDIDIVLFTDPRKGRGSTSLFGEKEIRKYKTNINKDLFVVQRINECDERKQTKKINKTYLNASKIADHVVFVSEWLRNIYINIGLEEEKSSVILSGSDRSVFNSIGRTDKPLNTKFSLVTHHWSSNWLKGFELYSFIDELIGENYWRNKIEFTYIGNIEKKIVFKNTKIIKPLSGLELSSELKQHDIYVTGSLNEPSGNHHIEAGLCGLPILYINSGGIPEYTKNFGLEVNINTFEDRLNYMIEYFSNFQKKMKGYPFDSETMCKKYLDLFENQ